MSPRSSAPHCCPEGPSTQCLRFLIPNNKQVRVCGFGYQKPETLDPLGWGWLDLMASRCLMRPSSTDNVGFMGFMGYLVWQVELTGIEGCETRIYRAAVGIGIWSSLPWTSSGPKTNCRTFRLQRPQRTACCVYPEASSWRYLGC